VRIRGVSLAVCASALLSALAAGTPARAQAPPGDQTAAVRAVLLRFAQARYADDGPRLCRLFTSRALRAFEFSGRMADCPRYLAKYFEPAPSNPVTLADMESRYAGAVIVVNGNRAVATNWIPSTLSVDVGGGQTTTGAVTETFNESLVWANGRWRIDSISATVG